MEGAARGDILALLRLVLPIRQAGARFDQYFGGNHAELRCAHRDRDVEPRNRGDASCVGGRGRLCRGGRYRRTLSGGGRPALQGRQ